MTRLAALAATVAAIGLSVGLWWWTQAPASDIFADCRGSAVAGGPGAIGGPFTLVNQDGVTVTDADVIDRPSILYFGYTFCPDVCPLDTARNVSAVEILLEQDLEVKPVFISIDPERDTPEALAAFVGNLHPQMVGLTGTPEQVQAASQAYRTFYQKQDADDGFYLMDHSTFSYLVLPGHGFVEFYRRETTPEAMAESMACFVQAAAAAN
jgi:protein SCO1/2